MKVDCHLNKPEDGNSFEFLCQTKAGVCVFDVNRKIRIKFELYFFHDLGVLMVGTCIFYIAYQLCKTFLNVKISSS